ncbi:MAG TPA: hypothetical protein VGR54_07140 [Nitrosopumilaceae archaeon]|nr:hypothetical protein [Nitrosopumilaceae archaeon]
MNEMFGRKSTETETNQEKKRELECEEAIMSEKTRFGRVRKTFMESMREEYGSDIANRALRRINKRRAEGYFRSG